MGSAACHAEDREFESRRTVSKNQGLGQFGLTPFILCVSLCLFFPPGGI